jgi:cytochrome P450
VSTSIDLFSSAFKADPYPAYAHLRQTDPVHRVDLGGNRGFWLITRYQDVGDVLKDPRFAKDFRNARTPEHIARMPHMPHILRVLDQNMLGQDPPVHSRLRGLVQMAFTPRLIARLYERIQTVADELLDAVQDRARMDLIGEYAFPLPIVIIAELLGVAARDRDRLRNWSAIMIGNDRSPTGLQRLVPSMHEFADYLRVMFDERRREPRDDLLSALVEAERSRDRLSEEELFGMVFLLLVAGHETTVNLIGNGTLALLQHPDQRQRLEHNPDLIKSAIEELLRFDGPVETSTARYAREDVEIGGTTIPRGAQVLAVIGSADRDSMQFPHPDHLDLARDTSGHVAFGHGIHYCLGAPLARLEGQIAIRTLLRRLPNLRLNAPAETLTWRSGVLLRGLERLPVAF